MPSFPIIGLPALEINILKVFTIYGRRGHLGYVIWTIHINFPSPFPTRLHLKLSLDKPSGFREDATCQVSRSQNTGSGEDF